ncbi:Plasmodium vivax Vir protein, putative [Plasmodium vivax]|nr:Plasmodium vivax Vir protein, putative [Plasmodium vivax]
MSPTNSTVQYSPISIAQSYVFLRELPLFKFYNELNITSTTPKINHDQCKNLTRHHDLYKICNQLGDILGNIKEINKLANVDVDNNNNNNRSCKYLNYLIREEIEKEKCDPNTLPSLYEALNTYNGSFENYKCNFEPNTNPDPDTDIAEKSKKLYYYTEYLYWITQKYNNIIKSNETDYYHFLNACVFYYNKLLQHDTCKENQKHKNELNDFKETYIEALENIKKIYPNITPKPMQDSEEAKESCTNNREKSQESDEEGFILFQSLTSNSRTRRPPPTLSDSVAIHQNSIPQDSQGSTIGKATPIICSTVAISMFSFILHKFTPLGTYLRRNKLIDRNRMDEKQDDNYKLLSDASQIPHNIAYQPVVN